MDVRINTDRIGDWKSDLLGHENARFIWVDSSDSPSQADLRADSHSGLQTASDVAKSIKLHEESHFLWLADANDIVIPTHLPSTAFIDYVRRIRHFCPTVFSVENQHGAADLTQRILTSPEALRALITLRTDDTYLYPYQITADIEALSHITSIPLAGIQSTLVYDALNSKCVGRKLCQQWDIDVPLGGECDTVGELRARLCGNTHLSYPLLVKEATEDSGNGHVVITSDDDARVFLQRFSALQDGDLRPYVIESFLDIPPHQNLNFRLLIAPSGKVALTDLHRSWVYPPDFYAYKTESPAAFDAKSTSAIYRAAEKLGSGMARNGFSGSVGVDGVITRDGRVFPVLDINPRLTGDVWMTNVVQQFGLSHHSMEVHIIEDAPLAAEFRHVDAALRHIGDPSKESGGVVVLIVSRKSSALTQALGRQTLKVKTLTSGTGFEDLRQRSSEVGKALRTTFYQAERLDAA